MRKILLGLFLAIPPIFYGLPIFGQATVTPALPAGIEISKSVLNLSKPNGGPFEPGDLLQIRATIYNTANTRYDEVRFQDLLPDGVTYVPGSRAIRNNEGKIIIGNLANSGAVPNFNLLAGPFVESGTGSRGSFANSTMTITIGATAGDGVTEGGIIGFNTVGTTGNFFPRQSNGLLIVATYHVTINSNVASNTTINLGGGTVRLGNITSSNVTDYTFGNLNILVFPAFGGVPRLRALNNISIAAQGTFGNGTTRNGSSLGANTGLNLVTMANAPTTTEVGDGNYAVVKNTSVNDGAAGTLANEMFNQNATGTIWGGLDVVGDHTGATNAQAGNAPAQGATAGGYLLLVNSNNSPTTVFSQTLNDVCPAAPYEISYWMRNLCPNCNSNGYNNGTTPGTWNPSGVPAGVAVNRTEPGVLPNISVNFDNRLVAQSGNIAYDRPGNLNTYPDNNATTGRFNTWKFRRLSLLSGSATSYAFALVNNSPGGGGNDWALDDIRISLAMPDILNLGNPLPPICPNTEVVLRSNVSSLQIAQATFNFYKWQRSSNNGASWTDVAGSNGSVTGSGAVNYITTLTVPASATALANNGDLYRIVVATSAANLGGANIAGTCAEVSANFRLNIVNSTAFCRPPVANNIINESMLNTAAATAINPLTATDQDGTITSYTISSLPNSLHGVLSLNGVPVILQQVLSPAEAAQLSFDPQATFTGLADFTYFATDNSGFNSNTATVSLPISSNSNNTKPIANNHGVVLINAQVPYNIPAFSGTVIGNGSIQDYEVLSIPSVAQGQLTYFNGTSYEPVLVSSILSPAQAATLRFTPAAGATNGSFHFNYRARDTGGNLSEPASYNFTLYAANTSPLGLIPPVAANIFNSPVSGNSGANLLTPLKATDADGTIASYRFSSLPLAAQGSLQYWSGGSVGSGTLIALTTGTVLTPAQAASLIFTPNPFFEGPLVFNYTATDNTGLVSSQAHVTISVTNRPPTANPILTPAFNRSDPSRPIPGLSGFDSDGTINAFNITNVAGIASEGQLFYRPAGTGALTPITGPITLTPAEASSLQFDPALSGVQSSATFSYTVSDNTGQVSTPSSYTIPLRQYSPPLVQDVIFNRTEGTGTVSTPTSFIPNTATWATPAGIAVTHLNDPIATDADGTIARFLILTVPNRGTEGQLRFPCNNACQLTLPGLFTQGCNGTTAGTGAGFSSADDGCLPANTRYRVNTQDPNLVEIVNANIAAELTLAQMQGLQFLPRTLTQGAVYSFAYSAVDNDGFIGNNARYFLPVSGTGLTMPPYALDRIATATVNTAVQAALPALSATDADAGGTINRYVIQSLPTANQGTLYLCAPTCVPVTAGQTIAVADAGKLTFSPNLNFTGTASFTYIAYDNDVPQKNSNVALVNIPVTSSGLPAAQAKEAVLINTAPSTPIPALSGIIVGSGTLQSFTVHNVPNAATAGLLTYFNGTARVPVAAGQSLTLVEASTLEFDPLAGFAGNILFQYSAQTFEGSLSNAATYTLRVTDPKPVASAVFTSIINKESAPVSLAAFPLNATDNGTIVFYTIQNLPDPQSGILEVCSGTCTAVSALQVLTPAEITQLRFSPTGTFTGSQASFNYTSTDNRGQIGNIATYLIPLEDPVLTITATPGCANDVPVLQYTINSNFDVNGKSLALIWTGSGTPQPIPNPNNLSQQSPIALPSLVISGTPPVWQYSQSIPFPGAIAATEPGGPNWPGWVFNGTTWVNEEDGFSSYRNGARLRATINSATVEAVNIVYSSSTPGCLTDPGLILRGKVWGDADGSGKANANDIPDALGKERGTNAFPNTGSQTLYAVAVARGKNGAQDVVLESKAINSDVAAASNFEFTRIQRNYNTANYDFEVVMSTTPGVVGSSIIPVASVPAGYEITVASRAIASGNSDITSLFYLGINQLPLSDDITANLGTLTVNVDFPLTNDPLERTDFEDDRILPAIGQSFVIRTLPNAADAILKYNGVPLAVNQLITNFDPSLLSIRFVRKFVSPGVPVVGASFTFEAVDNAGVVLNAGNNVLGSGGLSGVHTYTISLATILPVSGLQLTGQVEAGQVLLRWKTLQETGTNQFVIERSTNGWLYEAQGTVAAAGNSTTTTTYQWIDGNTTGQRSWYRVRLLDKDGTPTISNIVTVQAPANQIKVYPNPTKAQLFVYLPAKGQYQTDLMTMNGKLVWSKQISAAGNNVTLLNGMAHLARGFYLLKVTNTSTGHSEFVKVCFE